MYGKIVERTQFALKEKPSHLIKLASCQAQKSMNITPESHQLISHGKSKFNYNVEIVDVIN